MDFKDKEQINREIIMEDNLKKKTLMGLIWQYAEKCGTQVVNFVVSVILARLLTPADYGLIGLITVFISIALVFARSGMGQALVQKKDANDEDFSTVFYFSLAVSVAMYAILFLFSPLIANSYNEPELIPIIRVLGVTIIIGAVYSVQQAKVQREMDFKKFFYATLVGTLLSAVVGIVLAYSGYGVWALVWQQISCQLINILVLFFSVKWRPKLIFSFSKMWGLFNYSWKLLVSGLIDTAYNNMYSLIIGFRYSPSDLGYYNRGKQYPMLIIENVNGSINSVIFPVLSKMQDEKERFKATVRRSMKTSTYIIFPLMAGLAAVAEPLVRIMLTDKWLPAVPFIRFCCFTYAFWPVHTANLQAVKALGRSGIYLQLEGIKKTIGIVILIVTLPYGLTAMMFGRCIATISSSIINAFPNKKLIDYSYIEQIMDMLPSIILSVIMCVAVLLVGTLNINLYLLLGLQIIVGGVVYLGLSILFKLECFTYVLDILKGFLKKK